MCAVWFFCHFNFERNYDVLKSKIPSFLLNKKVNFHRNKVESKIESPNDILETRILCFSSYKNRNLKLKL